MSNLTDHTLENKIEGLRKDFTQTGFENACIGISGGKDSAVVAALLVRALGPEHVIPVIMPRGIMPDINDAKLLCQNLDLEPIYISIGTELSLLQTDIFNATHMPLSNNPIREAHGNATSRMRTLVLRYIAFIKDALVVGTTNKSEWEIGYFTKGGDDAVDIEPILDLTCTEVIELGKQMPEIPQHILEKAPNDGLHGRTDEQRLGVTYEQIDKWIETGTSGNTQADQRIQHLHNNTQHKRQNPILI